MNIKKFKTLLEKEKLSLETELKNIRSTLLKETARSVLSTRAQRPPANKARQNGKCHWCSD